MDKIIFLDIDGVLNDYQSEFCVDVFDVVNPTIVDGKLDLLYEIVEQTGAKIVLTSSWKEDWSDDGYQETAIGQFIDEKFANKGMQISGKTKDRQLNRGEGILQCVKDAGCSSWCILDDEWFDYEELEITDHLVKTTYGTKEIQGGLQEKHVLEAIAILNKSGEIN